MVNSHLCRSSLLVGTSLCLGLVLGACRKVPEPLEVATIRPDGGAVVFTTIYRGAHLAAMTPDDPDYSYNFRLVAVPCSRRWPFPATSPQPVEIRLLPDRGGRPAAEITSRVSCSAEYLDVRDKSYGRVRWNDACLNLSAGWYTGNHVNAFTVPGAITRAKQVCDAMK